MGEGKGDHSWQRPGGRKGQGLLVVNDKEGNTRGRGGPSVAALLSPTGPLVVGEHLQHDMIHS